LSGHEIAEETEVTQRAALSSREVSGSQFDGRSLAAAIGNQAMARVVARVQGHDDVDRNRSPEAVLLARAVGRAPSSSAQSLLRQALERVERDPSILQRSRADEAPGTLGGRCSCGGTILAGGECTQCLARRLQRQGMPRQEVRRVVLARTQATTRQLARSRSFMGCLNAHLSSFGIGWAVIALLGSVCGVLGAIAGLAGGPAAPATAPSGLAIAAAACIAVVTGASVGTVLAFIKWCWSNPDKDNWTISTASNDPDQSATPDPEAVQAATAMA